MLTKFNITNCKSAKVRMTNRHTKACCIPYQEAVEDLVTPNACGIYQKFFQLFSKNPPRFSWRMSGDISAKMFLKKCLLPKSSSKVSWRNSSRCSSRDHLLNLFRNYYREFFRDCYRILISKYCFRYSALFLQKSFPWFFRYFLNDFSPNSTGILQIFFPGMLFGFPPGNISLISSSIKISFLQRIFSCIPSNCYTDFFIWDCSMVFVFQGILYYSDCFKNTCIYIPPKRHPKVPAGVLLRFKGSFEFYQT